MFIFKILILFLIPYGLYELDKRKIKLITSLSVIVWCYLLGFFLNILGIGFDHNLAQTVAAISFPLSLPLLLFEVNFSSWLKLAKPAVKGFMVAIFASMITLIIVPLFFKDVPQIEKYAAMMAGMMTGGSVNFTALSVAFDVDANSYIGLYTSEAILGAVYLLLVFKFSNIFLKKYFVKYDHAQKNHEAINKNLKFNYKNAAVTLLASIAIVGISFLATKMFFKKIETTFLILTITTLSLVLGSQTKLSKIKESYPLGEYFLNVFCLSLGLLLDINQLSQIGLNLFLFVTISYLLVIFIHFTLCKVIKLDGDTALITNIAGIFGPPFILPVAKILKNDAIVMSGLTTSLVGQALGTYIGFLVYWILKSIF